MFLFITLLKGVAIGLFAAIPVGPVGVLCIQRTLDKGRMSGFISGLGAATVDAFYGAVAAFSLMVIVDFLNKYHIIIQLVGVAFLLYFGIKIFFAPKKENNFVEKGTDIVADFFSAFLLTATNPTTVVTFAALFAMTSAESMGGGYMIATVLVIGVFLGSALWWFILSFGVERVREKMENFPFIIIHKISGVITVLFAVVILFSALSDLISIYY